MSKCCFTSVFSFNFVGHDEYIFLFKKMNFLHSSRREFDVILPCDGVCSACMLWMTFQLMCTVSGLFVKTVRAWHVLGNHADDIVSVASLELRQELVDYLKSKLKEIKASSWLSTEWRHWGIWVSAKLVYLSIHVRYDLRYIAGILTSDKLLLWQTLLFTSATSPCDALQMTRHTIVVPVTQAAKHQLVDQG